MWNRTICWWVVRVISSSLTLGYLAWEWPWGHRAWQTAQTRRPPKVIGWDQWCKDGVRWRGSRKLMVRIANEKKSVGYFAMCFGAGGVENVWVDEMKLPLRWNGRSWCVSGFVASNLECVAESGRLWFLREMWPARCNIVLDFGTVFQAMSYSNFIV